jgi:hypothetical protein
MVSGANGFELWIGDGDNGMENRLSSKQASVPTMVSELASGIA